MEDDDNIGHLVVSRLPGERVCIGNDIAVEVVKVLGDKVVLSIRAPRRVPLFRQEVLDRIRRENRAAARPVPTVLEAGLAAAVVIPVLIVPTVPETRASFQAAIRKD